MLADAVVVPALDLDELLEHQRRGAVVLDARDDVTFAAGHVRGAVNVGLGGRFAEYAGEVMRPGASIVLVTEPGKEVEAAVRLARIGFDGVLGALAEPVTAFLARPEVVEPLSRLSASALAERMASVPDLVVVDVRNPGELAVGTIPGARHIALPALLDHLDDLDAERADGRSLRGRLPVGHRRQPPPGPRLRRRVGPAGRVRGVVCGGRGLIQAGHRHRYL